MERVRHVGLAFVHIETRAGDLFVAQCIDERRGINHVAARGVDEKGAFTHEREALRIHEMAGFRCRWTVQRYEVSAAKQLFDGLAAFGTHGRCNFGRWRKRIVVDHAHAEAEVCALCDGLSDPSKSHESKHLAGYLGAHHVSGAPAGPSA